MDKTEKSFNNFNISFKSNVNEKTNQNPSVAICRKERGITLIALVVTIVVLIILATISINAVLGDDGLIKQAERARDIQANAEASDSEALSEYDQMIANAMADIEGNGGSQTPDEPQEPENPSNPDGGDGETPDEPDEPVDPLAEYKKDSMLTKKENTEITIGDDTVWIPAGFKVHEDTADTVDEGIVITDGTNEFVWVPVDETSFNAMFGTSNTELALCGSTNVTTNYYSNLRVRSGDSSSYAATTPGTTSVTVNGSSVTGEREPDLVTNYDSDSYAVQAGYENLADMAQGFVDDYTNMRASIEKYDGFYIGRYELTGTIDSPTVKAGVVLTASSSQAGNWYGLYKACRGVKEKDEYVTSTMIWGAQWDETMNWLKNTKFKGNESAVDSDSSSWGNYKDVSVKASDGETEIKASGTSTKLETGITTYTMANNIYDLAGNYYEWTQEADYASHRVFRGR